MNTNRRVIQAAIVIILLASFILLFTLFKSSVYAVVLEEASIIGLYKTDTFTDYGAINDNACTKLVHYHHHVNDGDKSVFILYQTDRKNIFDNHDDSFKRLSIEASSLEVNKTISTESEKLKIYYSEGGLAPGIYCNGYYVKSKSGDITIKEITNKGIEVEINVRLNMFNARSSNEEKTVVIKETQFFKREMLKNLDGMFRLPGYITKAEIDKLKDKYTNNTGRSD